MENRVTVKIHHKDYSIIAEEEPEYIRQCAEMVADEVERVLTNSTLNLEDGAILTALNMADLLCKERQNTARVQTQLRKAQEDSRRQKKGQRHPGQQEEGN